MAKATAKKYNLGGGMSLHDARRVLGVPIIAHTGHVNSHARCVGTTVKRAKVHSVSEARKIFTTAATGGCKD
ncbi:MAG: hypothetical protein WC331_09985 [Candidatus Omnitrophota bacterium]|jgi:hypothetical protein